MKTSITASDALLVAVAALTLAAVAFVSRSRGDHQHRCGNLGNARLEITCISGDEPKGRAKRGCAPVGSEGGIVFWRCRE